LEYEFRLEKAKKRNRKQRVEADGKAIVNTIFSASITDKIWKEKVLKLP